MTHLSLFSGIGGIDLAAHWAGFKTVAFVEQDSYCQRVLAKNFPGVPIYNDVANYEPVSAERSPILISAGFPCQPFSDAGPRTGVSDARWLWGHIERLLSFTGAQWFLGENVAGLLSIDRGRTFGYILRRLGEIGYRVGWTVYGAWHVGAPHERDRVFIVANSTSERWVKTKPYEATKSSESCREAQGYWGDIRFAFARERSDLIEWGTNRPSWFLRGYDGLPPGLDRLRALGNAVVPQQVYPILKAIADQIQGASA